MDSFDFVVIGAGASGEAAASYAAIRGKSVALIEKDLVGGACAYWACIPTKTLLHAAEVRACGGDYSWQRASDRRDYMINRERRDYPDDSSHARGHEKAGITVIRGTAKIAGQGRVDVTADGRVRSLEAKAIVLASGSRSRIPRLDGLEEAGYWTNVEASSLRELPRSVIVLGAGPSGVELAQIYQRFGVRTTIVQSNERLNPTDHPRSSELLAKAFRREGIDVRTKARAMRVRPRAGTGGEHLIDLSDGSVASGEVIVIGIGRTPNVSGLGLDTVGVATEEGRFLVPDGGLRVAEDVYAVGDVIGREISTHLGHYEGELAVRMALGDDITPDLRPVPRCVYTEPELAAVGLRLDQAEQAGHDALEVTDDLATTAKGYVAEAEGHVTVVVDRRERVLLGAFIAGPGAAEAIHEAVLAIKLRVPVATLEDTIHAFPTTSRALWWVIARASRQLDPRTAARAS